MKFKVPVSLREYENAWIAETLSGPSISVSGIRSKATLDRLKNAIIDVYSRTHPRILKDILTSHPTELHQEVRSVYKSSRYEWMDTVGTAWHDNLLPIPIDVLSVQHSEELSELSLPQFGLRSIAHKNDDIDVIDRMLDALRKRSWESESHRARAKTTTLVHLEIDFQPIDLSKVHPESIHINEFSRNDLVGGINSKATPTLSKVAQKWQFETTQEAEKNGFSETFGREKLIAELDALVDGKKPISIVLVGRTRVGKTAAIRHLGWARSHKGSKKRALYFADSPRLTSTAPQGGLWQEQVQSILEELENTDSILYIGKLIAALDAGKYDGSDYNLAQFLRPTLGNNRVRIIAEASSEEWAELEKRDIGFSRVFTVVKVEDPPSIRGQKIVSQAIQRFVKELDFEVEANAISRAWELQRRFAVYGSPVGRTIEFMIRTIRRSMSQYESTLKEDDLVLAFCKDTGLPPILLLDSQQLRPQNVYNALAQRVFGQDEAIQSVANIISITKAGLSSPDRPLGSFMFVGPTGVGKTELAKALAEFLFGSEERMTRLDMSEYSQSDAYGRLIGEGGQDGDLSGPVQREPFCVILLDEIEKAHPSVYDVLLQVLGEARLTDVKGRTTRFQNTIIIMTSNLGVDTMRPSIGFGETKSTSYSEHFRKEAERFYRPEFLGRIDQFIAFQSLPLDIVTAISRRALSKIEQRDGFVSQDISIQFSKDVAPFLARAGYHEKYGARPLKREIEQSLVWKLAKKLAETKSMVDVGGSRKISISIVKDAIDIKVDAISPSRTDYESRSSLLSQVDEVSNLRRRLSTYMHTSLFTELEWEVENFDISTQSPLFWDDPRAAELATNAEKLRRVVQPADEIANELATLEDLSAEAYHTRSFDLVPDIHSRVVTLESKVDEIYIQAMNASYEDLANEVVLFLFDRSPQHPFCKMMIQWYQKWALKNDWEFSIWIPIEVEMPEEEYRMDFEKKSWKKLEDEEYPGELFALNFKGYNARPMIRVEEGLHRYVSNSGNGTCQIVVLGEQTGWPYSDDVAKRSYPNYSARTYNFRTNDVTLYFGSRAEVFGEPREPVIHKLSPENPISALSQSIVDEAWELSAMDWE